MKRCIDRDCKETDLVARGRCNNHYSKWMRANHPGRRESEQKRMLRRYHTLRKEHLCQSCKGPVAVRITFQGKKVMKREVLTYCFKDGGDRNKEWKKTWGPKRKSSSSCTMCHGNPAKLCEECAKR